MREHASGLSAVLLDATLRYQQGMNILDVTRDIRADVPFILTMRYNEDEPVHDMQVKAGSRLLRKPFRIEELLSHLRSAIEA